MRHLLAIFLVLSVMVALAGEAARAQVGFDRPGSDYTNFVVTSGDPTACAARCERDAHCRAWSFSCPFTANRTPLCWVKGRVNTRVLAPCCTSGVRAAGVVEPRAGPIEFSIDRVGGDYRSLDLPPDPTGAACKAACDAEGRC